jgi:hypothetical protein
MPIRRTSSPSSAHKLIDRARALDSRPRLRAVPRKDCYRPGAAAVPPWFKAQQAVGSLVGRRFEGQEADRAVEALYQGLLGRASDPEGHAAHKALLEQGRVGEVVDGFVSSPEFRQRTCALTPESLSQALYQSFLGRAPDPEGDLATRSAITRGHLAHRVFDILHSAEFEGILRQPKATPQPPEAPVPTPPKVPGPPANWDHSLTTIPWRPEFAQGVKHIDQSSAAAAAKSAAQWVKDTYPDLFAKADDRQVCFEIMGRVIGVLRAAGHDAYRVVNHPSRPVGDGWRYGSDAVVMSGRVWDVYVAIGEANTPAAQDVGAADLTRPRE